jgi:serine/threonine protein kinase
LLLSLSPHISCFGLFSILSSRTLAIKRFYPKFQMDSLREVYILSSIEHPNIVKYYTHFEAQFRANQSHYPHIVLESLELDLRKLLPIISTSLLSENGASSSHSSQSRRYYSINSVSVGIQNEPGRPLPYFPISHIKCWMQDLLRGLSYLSARSIRHGDIKPDNLIMDSEGNIKIGKYSEYQSQFKLPPIV